MAHRTQLLLDKVDSYQRSGKWSPALDLCARAFRESWIEGAAFDLTEVVLRTGFILSAQGERELAIEQFELAETIANLQEDPSRAARALNGLGVVHQAIGRLDDSHMYYSAALIHSAAAGDRLTLGDVEMNLGIISNIRGDLHQALKHYRVAHAQYEAIKNQSRLAKVLNNIGMLHIDLQEFSEAGEALEEALVISRMISDLATEGIIHANKTELFLSIGRVDDARTSCDQAFEISSRLHDDVLKTDLLKSYGIIFRDTKKPHLAESHFNQSIQLAIAIGNPLLEAEATRELSLVLREQDRNRESLEALNRAHSLFSLVQAKQDEADIASRLRQLEDDFLSLVARWGESIEAKDRYTSGHCQRVADYACEIAKATGMADMDLTWFRMGAFLHDVGKTEVPEEILNKPGRLTDEERAIIEQHTVVGDEMLSSIEFPWDIRPMVRSHHERWDGRGYPDGLVGHQIPHTARILKIVDVFDALTTTRSYRQPLSAEQAIQLMDDDRGAFDLDLLEIFKNVLPDLISKSSFLASNDLSSLPGR